MAVSSPVIKANIQKDEACPTEKDLFVSVHIFLGMINFALIGASVTQPRGGGGVQARRNTPPDLGNIYGWLVSSLRIRLRKSIDESN